jgi:tryptophan-rich sensory protein
MKSIKARELPRLILSIMICQAAGITGSIFTSSSVSTWYTTLIKPEFTPPGSVISAVWLIPPSHGHFAVPGLARGLEQAGS